MDRDNTPAPAPFTTDPSGFEDLQARNERRRAAQVGRAERRHRIERVIEQRIARVIEATRAHARSKATFQPGRQSRSGSDRS